MIRSLLSAGLILSGAVLAARPLPAQMPSTDIWIVPVHMRDGLLHLDRPANITDRAGYDNQPAFAPDGRTLLYSSEREGQTDIFVYNLNTGTSRRLTATPESEFSPLIAPDGRSFTVVRVEADSTQRIWRFPLGGTAEPRVLLPNVRPVGYYAWADDRTIALFVLGTGGGANTLRVSHLRSGVTERVMEGIGRSLHRIPGTNRVSFVHAAAVPRAIFSLDPHTQAMTRIAPLLEGSEDFAWVNGETLIMAQGTRLYQRGGTPTAQLEWREVADLSEAGVGRITRLAVNVQGNWLAFVSDRESAPDTPADAADRDATADSMVVRERDVRFALEALAADSMEGRLTGTPGIHRAARFLASQFAAVGLAGAGDSATYFQRVPIFWETNAQGQRRLRRAASWEAWRALPAADRLTDVNVVGMIPGGDPALRDEVVLVTAHYDHVGIGRPMDRDSLRAIQRVAPGAPRGLSAAEQAEFRRIVDSARAGGAPRLDSIYNGADDDASGTVALIEIARQLRAGPPPRRTVLFAAMTGEERGLLGTNWYLDHPIVPLEQTVANLNIEMIGRPDSLAGGAGRAWLTGYERSTMGDMLRREGIPIVQDPRPAQNFFMRSDNIGFARRGVPAHTLSSFNLHGDYHRPTDETDLVDYAHMAQVIAAAARAARILADGERVVWHPGGQPEPR